MILGCGSNMVGWGGFAEGTGLAMSAGRSGGRGNFRWDCGDAGECRLRFSCGTGIPVWDDYWMAWRSLSISVGLFPDQRWSLTTGLGSNQGTGRIRERRHCLDVKNDWPEEKTCRLLAGSGN